MKKLLIATPLAVGLLAPCYLFARQDHDRDRDDRHPYAYYDPHYRDWHEWNDNSDREWHSYLEERHQNYVPFYQADERERDRYWKWEHKHHPDHDRH
jgi:hypothetical protein